MSNADLVSTIAHILEPWAFETKSYNATIARDDATAKATQIVEALAALDSRAGDAGEGKTDSEIIAFANRFYDPADNGSGADIRKWIKAVRAALSSTPAPAVDAATERQAALAKLTAMDDDGFPDEPLPISPNVAEQFAENAKSAVDAVPAGEDSHHD